MHASAALWKAHYNLLEAAGLVTLLGCFVHLYFICNCAFSPTAVILPSLPSHLSSIFLPREDRHSQCLEQTRRRHSVSSDNQQFQLLRNALGWIVLRTLIGKCPDLQGNSRSGRHDSIGWANRPSLPSSVEAHNGELLVSYKDERYPELPNNVSYDRPRYSISRRLCQAASICSISRDEWPVCKPLGQLTTVFSLSSPHQPSTQVYYSSYK